MDGRIPMISVDAPPLAKIIEACAERKHTSIDANSRSDGRRQQQCSSSGDSGNANSRDQNEHEKGDRERQGQRSSYSRSRERGSGRKRQGIESREEEVMATAAPGDREIENGAAGGVVHHASANNAAEEVEVNPVEAKKEEVEKVMLGLPRFRVLAEAVMPRDNRSSRGSRDRSDVSRSDSGVYLLCLVIQKFLL